MKKLLLSIGSIAAVVTPVVAVVSCGDKKETNGQNSSVSHALETLRKAETQYKEAGIMVWKSSANGGELKANSFTATDLVDGTSTVLKDGVSTSAYTKAADETANIQKFTTMAATATTALTELVGANKMTEITAFTTAAAAAYTGANTTWGAKITAVDTAAKALVSQLPANNSSATDGTATMTTLENKTVLHLDGADKNVLEAMVFIVKVYKTIAFLSATA